MSKADEAKAIIHDISDKNVDEIVRASSFTNEVEEVGSPPVLHTVGLGGSTD